MRFENSKRVLYRLQYLSLQVTQKRGFMKAKMIPSDAVEEVIGHAPGGVCPFGINDGVEVYLDESLKKFTIVYPAAGNDHSAVKLTIPELEQIAGAKGWVDVCKEENV